MKVMIGKKRSIVTVRMIVVMATGVVSVFLPIEIDQNAIKMAISSLKIGKKVLGLGVGIQGQSGHPKHRFFFLALCKIVVNNLSLW